MPPEELDDALLLLEVVELDEVAELDEEDELDNEEELDEAELAVELEDEDVEESVGPGLSPLEPPQADNKKIKIRQMSLLRKLFTFTSLYGLFSRQSLTHFGVY